mmetsp:Transcript_92892/g.220840  ORF Transcript_92892/g.220840 Transcript_92892/m.220840 type:complete len:254 (+) Transcript_92892:777-1538(+)
MRVHIGPRSLQVFELPVDVLVQALTLLHVTRQSLPGGAEHLEGGLEGFEVHGGKVLQPLPRHVLGLRHVLRVRLQGLQALGNALLQLRPKRRFHGLLVRGNAFATFQQVVDGTLGNLGRGCHLTPVTSGNLTLAALDVQQQLRSAGPGLLAVGYTFVGDQGCQVSTDLAQLGSRRLGSAKQAQHQWCQVYVLQHRGEARQRGGPPQQRLAELRVLGCLGPVQGAVDHLQGLRAVGVVEVSARHHAGQEHGTQQ